MRVPDAFDMSDAEDEDRGGETRCRRCGLLRTWCHTGVRWALLDGQGRLHQCGSVPSADDFEDVS